MEVTRPPDAAPINLRVGLGGHGEPDVYVPRGFICGGRAWIVTSGYGWSRSNVRFWISEYPDGSGERREVTPDELEAMLGVR